MLGLNAEIVNLINELQHLDYRKKMNRVEEAETDKYGFPFEPLEAVSTEPLGFVETAMRLHTASLELFRLVSRVSRFSPLFPRVSGRLEKMLAQLGSCCVTKAVLEQQQGEEFRFLNALTIDSLRRIAAFNLRKCHACFMESSASGFFKPEAFDLSVRWAALDRRLEATGEKIEKIKAGKISISLSEKETPAAPRKEAAENDSARNGSVPFTEKANAFPVDKAAVREADRQRCAESPAAEIPPADEPGNPGPSAQTPEAEEDPAAAAPEAEPKPVIPGCGEDPEPSYSDEEFKRDILLIDALDSGGPDDWEAVDSAPKEELEARWTRYMERESHSGYPHLKQLGYVVEAQPPPDKVPEFAEKEGVRNEE